MPDLPLKDIRKSYVKERLEREELLKNLSVVIEDRNNIKRENDLLKNRMIIIEHLLRDFNSQSLSN